MTARMAKLIELYSPAPRSLQEIYADLMAERMKFNDNFLGFVERPESMFSWDKHFEEVNERRQYDGDEDEWAA